MNATVDATDQIASISALEAATDALLIALGRRPEPDLEAAMAALRAREAALKFIVATAPGKRPPDLNARLRRTLERDQEANAQMREEMNALRERINETKQLMRSYRRPARAEADDR
jgi:hypothetical protein